MEKFIVKHYTDDPHPSIKGNGFDGLVIGDYREEADKFIEFVNKNMSVADGVSSKMQPVVMQPGDVEERAGLQDGVGVFNSDRIKEQLRRFIQQEKRHAKRDRMFVKKEYEHTIDERLSDLEKLNSLVGQS